MPRDLAHRPNVCCVLTEREEHQRREGGEARRLELRQPFPNRVSYRALLVAVALASFGGVLVGVLVGSLNAGEAEKVKYRPPAGIPVEMPKPLRCSIETPSYCNVLPSRAPSPFRREPSSIFRRLSEPSHFVPSCRGTAAASKEQPCPRSTESGAGEPRIRAGALPFVGLRSLAVAT
jgi:hypothetical protein